jgi:hypothetical protein
LRIFLGSDVGGEVGKTFGFEGGPEREFVGKGNRAAAHVGDLGGGRFDVQSGKRGGVAREDSGAPVVERREGLLLGEGGGREGQGQQQTRDQRTHGMLDGQDSTTTEIGCWQVGSSKEKTGERRVHNVGS